MSVPVLQSLRQAAISEAKRNSEKAARRSQRASMPAALAEDLLNKVRDEGVNSPLSSAQVMRKEVEEPVIAAEVSLPGGKTAEASAPVEIPVEEGQVVAPSGCRHELWLFLSGVPSPRGLRRFSHSYEVFSITLVILNVCLDIVASVPEYNQVEDLKGVRELPPFVGIVFTVEYVLRLFCCVESPSFPGGCCMARLRWAMQPLSLVDLVVVVGFLLTTLTDFQASGLTALRMVRMLRILALLKLERGSNSFSNIFKVFHKKQHELFASFVSGMMIMVMSGCLMYYIENSSQPDKFGSIPDAMWWSLAALTTVGYGDLAPITGFGRFLGGIVAIFGIALFALPAGILGAGYVDVLAEEAAEMRGEQAEERSESKELNGDSWARSKSSESPQGVDESHEASELLMEMQTYMRDSFQQLQQGLQDLREEQVLLLERMEKVHLQEQQHCHGGELSSPTRAKREEGLLHRISAIEVAANGQVASGGLLQRLETLEAALLGYSVSSSSGSTPDHPSRRGTLARVAELEVCIFGQVSVRD